MNNIIKLMYCLCLGSPKLSYKISYYSKYATLIDMRTLKLGFKDGFVVEKADATKKLLEYLINKNQYQTKAKQRWEAIRDSINGEETWE